MITPGFTDMLEDGQVNACMGARDGECAHRVDRFCPQLREGEPHKSGRHCPLDLGCSRCGYKLEECAC